MKLIISTVVVGIVLFMLGWVIYGMSPIGVYLNQYFGHMQRGEADMKIWAFALANFGQAFMMYLIYSKGYQGGSPVMEGIKFGILIGLFWTIPYVLFTWGGMTVAWQGVVVDGIIGFIMTMIAAVITALIHGKREVKAA